MTGDPLTWVDLYHPGLGAEFRATDAAFQDIHRHKGWVLRDEVAIPLLAQAMDGSKPLSEVDQRIVLAAVFPGEDFTRMSPESMAARFDVLPHHSDADTAIGRRLAELQDLGPAEFPPSPSPEVGSYDPSSGTILAVNAYLQGQIDAGNLDEVQRVLHAEEQGQNRKGIVVDGPAAKQRKE